MINTVKQTLRTRWLALSAALLTSIAGAANASPPPSANPAHVPIFDFPIAWCIPGCYCVVPEGCPCCESVWPFSEAQAGEGKTESPERAPDDGTRVVAVKSRQTLHFAPADGKTSFSAEVLYGGPSELGSAVTLLVGTDFYELEWGEVAGDFFQLVRRNGDEVARVVLPARGDGWLDTPDGRQFRVDSAGTLAKEAMGGVDQIVLTLLEHKTSAALGGLGLAIEEPKVAIVIPILVACCLKAEVHCDQGVGCGGSIGWDCNCSIF